MCVTNQMLDQQHGIALVCVRLSSGILSITCLVDFTRSLVSVLILTTQFVHTPRDLLYIAISFTAPQVWVCRPIASPLSLPGANGGHHHQQWPQPVAILLHRCGGTGIRIQPLLLVSGKN